MSKRDAAWYETQARNRRADLESVEAEIARFDARWNTPGGDPAAQHAPLHQRTPSATAIRRHVHNQGRAENLRHVIARHEERAATLRAKEEAGK